MLGGMAKTTRNRSPDAAPAEAADATQRRRGKAAKAPASKVANKAPRPAASRPAKPAASKRAATVAPSSSKARPSRPPPAAKPARKRSETPVEVQARPARPRTATQRENAFDALVRSACLRAGTAAAISSLTRRVPLLGRLAPTLLGPLAETVALAQVQKVLVGEIIELYEVELSDPEQRGVVLLATATNIGAQQLSKRSMDAILKQFGEGMIGTIAARVLPMATILAEITAAVASTYTVAKRAQALCKLPGTGAGNLAELLRGLSGIDQQRLLSWSGEAFRLALVPFRGVLGMLWR